MLLQLSSHLETCLLVRFCYLLSGLCNNLPPIKGGTELVQMMNIIANDFIRTFSKILSRSNKLNSAKLWQNASSMFPIRGFSLFILDIKTNMLTYIHCLTLNIFNLFKIWKNHFMQALIEERCHGSSEAINLSFINFSCSSKVVSPHSSKKSDNVWSYCWFIPLFYQLCVQKCKIQLQ